MSRIADQLLRAVDPLPAPQVDPYVARFARGLAERPLTELIDRLDSRGPYERRLAALAALATRRGDWLAGRLGDRDEGVRRYAFRAVRQGLVPDAAIESAYPVAASVERGRLAEAVLAGRRTELADRMVDRVRAQWGEDEAARLLPACSPATVARLLPELAHAGNGPARLARRHPTLFLDRAERELAGRTQQLRDAWWQWRADAVAAVLPVDPARVLALLERYGPGALPRQVAGQLGLLVALDAERVVRWLLDPARAARPLVHQPSRSLVRRLVLADPPSLGELGRRWYEQPQLFLSLLRALPPSRRGAFFETATKGLELTRFTELDLLPRERRHAWARAEADRREAAGQSRLGVLAMRARLPVAEVGAELLAATRRPAAEERAQAWPLLIANAGGSGDPADLARLLPLLDRLRNEQDPVRSAALGALAQLHPRLFAPADVTALSRLVTTRSRPGTAPSRPGPALRRLAVGVLRENATEAGSPLLEWSLTTLQQLAGHFGGADLRPAGAHPAAGPGAPGPRRAAHPGCWPRPPAPHHRLLFALTGSLGRRAHRMPELQALLADALEHSDYAAFPHRRAVLAGRPGHPGRPGGARAPARPLGRRTAAGAGGADHRRTDLLDPLLPPSPPYGRFLPRAPGAAGRRWSGPGAGRPSAGGAARLAAGTVADPPSRSTSGPRHWPRPGASRCTARCWPSRTWTPPRWCSPRPRSPRCPGPTIRPGRLTPLPRPGWTATGPGSRCTPPPGPPATSGPRSSERRLDPLTTEAR
ncbi:hypothetical protein GCM10020229_47460 [Kitasatospora albolonga]|uniref:hypothetical protein n=1 Tax=Kitasatospora albolonga TaxID=68173 RepID=UPI0031ED540C